MMKFCLAFCFLLSLITAQNAFSKANTALTKISVSELNQYKAQFKKTPKTNSLYPEKIRIDSVTNAADPKLLTVLVFFKSSDSNNQLYLNNFWNLWFKHKDQVNFVLIDLDEPLSYYATILLREYWKDEPLKILALSPSGKIRIQLTDPRDLSQLDFDLRKLAAELNIKTNNR